MVKNADTKFTIIINDIINIKQVDKHDYLSVTITREGFGSAKIKNIIEHIKRIIDA